MSDGPYISLSDAVALISKYQREIHQDDVAFVLSGEARQQIGMLECVKFDIQGLPRSVGPTAEEK